MATILKTRKLWSVVDEGIPTEPTGEVTPETAVIRTRREDAINHDLMALQLLQTAVTDHIFSRIAAATTSKEAWDALKTEYQGSTQVRLIKLQTLRREYENLKMHDGESLKSFTDKLIELENQLTYHGEKKTNAQLVQKILISLPSKYDSIVSVLEQTRDLDALSMSELIGILKAHEARLSVREEGKNEGAFNAYSKGKESTFKQDNNEKQGKDGRKWCTFCKKKNHTEAECWKKSKNDNKEKSDKSNIKCYNCGKIGHYSNKCRSKKKERAHMIVEEGDSSEDDHMMFNVSEVEASTTTGDVWLVDSGCTNHMTREEGYFSRINKSVNVPIKVGNGQVVMSTGKGDITVMTSKGKKEIRNVFLVPELEKNLLSVPQIISNGYRVNFEDEKCTIMDRKGNVLMEIPMTHKSFRIKLRTVQDEAMIASDQGTNEIWHKRFGHISNKRMQQIQENNLVNGLPKFKVYKDICEACKFGKQSRKGFPKESQTKTKEKHELIHTDVCGPMQTPSLDGSRFFLLFLDDFTHMCWVYFLKQKSETFPIFKKFKAMIEKQTGCAIKTLRSDGGGEFTSQEFNNFCEEEGIKRQVTLPYSPQQNGTAERKNRSLVEMARSMIAEQGLPNKLWAEAVYMSAYIQNRVPSKAIENDTTPIEKWCGHKPNVSHWRTFGSLCYVHIADQRRRKLDAKAKRGIFIGYSNKSKGYRVFILENEKVEVSRDVEFDESKTWDWNKGKEEVKKNIVLQITHDSTSREQSRNTNDSQENVETQRQANGNDLYDQINQESNGFNQLQISNQGGEDSVGPRGYRSINELLEKEKEVDVAAQVIEACFLVHEEPQTYDEACVTREWRNAMNEEI